MSTKTIDTTDLRNNLSATINAVGKDDILFIKSRGKLTGKVIIDDDLLEDLLLLPANTMRYWFIYSTSPKTSSKV